MAIKNASRQYPLVAEVIVEGGTDLTATGTYEAIDLPAGATIIGGYYEVIDTFTGTGTVAVQVGATVLAAADAGNSAGITEFGTTHLPTLTAADTVDLVVATAALTDGKAKVSVMYVIEGRAHEAG